jgi:hypothetical protein
MAKKAQKCRTQNAILWLKIIRQLLQFFAQKSRSLFSKG